MLENIGVAQAVNDMLHIFRLRLKALPGLGGAAPQCICELFHVAREGGIYADYDGVTQQVGNVTIVSEAVCCAVYCRHGGA